MRLALWGAERRETGVERASGQYKTPLVTGPVLLCLRRQLARGTRPIAGPRIPGGRPLRFEPLAARPGARAVVGGERLG